MLVAPPGSVAAGGAGAVGGVTVPPCGAGSGAVSPSTEACATSETPDADETLVPFSRIAPQAGSAVASGTTAAVRVRATRATRTATSAVRSVFCIGREDRGPRLPSRVGATGRAAAGSDLAGRQQGVELGVAVVDADLHAGPEPGVAVL